MEQTRAGHRSATWSVAPGGVTRAVHHGVSPRLVAPYAASLRWHRPPTGPGTRTGGIDPLHAVSG
jgi:hypothetical protein